MKKAPYIAALIVLLFSASALAAIPIEVTVGKGTILDLKKQKATRVSLTNPKVADIILMSPTEILLNGNTVGTTTLITWTKEGKRTFFDVIVFGDLDELRAKVEALTPDDEVQVERAGDTLLLKGTLKSEDTIAKVDLLSKAYAAKVVNFLRVTEPQQVMLEVKVAQMDRTKLKELGLGALFKHDNVEVTAPGLLAAPDGNVGGGAGFNVTPGIGSFDIGALVPQIGVAHFPIGVAATLRALSSKGLAKILAEPNLVVRSGEKGEFLAGSRIPVQQVTGVGAGASVSIVFEEVGIKLNFEPVVLDDGTIRLKIDPAEVSNITGFLTFGTITAPQIDTRTVSTSVDLKAGESLVLAGLLSEEMKKNIQKIPILGDIPILGAFFRSTRDEMETKELAFFITPKLVKPIPPGDKPVLPGEEGLTPEEEREFQWIPLGVPASKKSSMAE